MTTFSDILNEFKTRTGWTDQRIAEAVGVSRPAINQWLNKKSQPAIRQLPALARLLKRPWPELAAIILGEGMGEQKDGLSAAQLDLLAQTSDLADAEMNRIMGIVEVLYPREKKTPEP